MVKKINALITSIAITLIILSNFYLFSKINKNDSLQNVAVTRVIDGDTIEIDSGQIIRLVNINSPEKNMPNSNLSKIFLQDYLNKTIKIEFLGKDKYFRELARIYSDSYINLELVKRGFASKFLVNEKELSDFDNAEADAIKNEKGIWKHSEYFTCISTKIEEKTEQIIIKNNCRKININNWYVKDESRKVYFFKNLSLGSVILNSGIGKNNETDIFWNNKQNIWNDDRDSLYLFDDKNKIVYYLSYGY